jgi:hypothetical protein
MTTTFLTTRWPDPDLVAHFSAKLRYETDPSDVHAALHSGRPGFEYWAREGLPVQTDDGVARPAPDPLTTPVTSLACDC